MMLCKPSISTKLGYASLLLQVCSQYYSLKTPFTYETHYEFGLYEMTCNKNFKKMAILRWIMAVLVGNNVDF